MAAGREAGRAYLLPRWGKIKAAAITRADVRADDATDRGADRRQSGAGRGCAIFTWAIRQEILTVNPCQGVERNPTTDRERVLSDAEVTLLWPELDPA